MLLLELEKYTPFYSRPTSRTLRFKAKGILYSSSAFQLTEMRAGGPSGSFLPRLAGPMRALYLAEPVIARTDEVASLMLFSAKLPSSNTVRLVLPALSIPLLGRLRHRCPNPWTVPSPLIVKLQEQYESTPDSCQKPL